MPMFDYCQRLLGDCQSPMHSLASQFFRVPCKAMSSTDVLVVNAFIETIALRAHLAGEIQLPESRLRKHLDANGRLIIWDEIAKRLS